MALEAVEAATAAVPVEIALPVTEVPVQDLCNPEQMANMSAKGDAMYP